LRVYCVASRVSVGVTMALRLRSTVQSLDAACRLSFCCCCLALYSNNVTACTCALVQPVAAVAAQIELDIASSSSSTTTTAAAKQQRKAKKLSLAAAATAAAAAAAKAKASCFKGDTKHSPKHFTVPLMQLQEHRTFLEQLGGTLPPVTSLPRMDVLDQFEGARTDAVISVLAALHRYAFMTVHNMFALAHVTK
jgi:hypothetical protein